MIFTDKFYEVLKHEGVVSIITWGLGEPHVTNTWNSYLVVKNDHTLLIPAGGMHSTEEDIKINPQIKITLGSKNVIGFNNYQGTGFRIEGLAKFIYEGEDFDLMKEKFKFISRVLHITANECKQLL